MTNPTAAIIVIGDEILSGRTKDKNIGWLAEQLNSQGIQLREARVIPDIRETIIETVKTMSAAHDLVFTSGGIGPTHDDITTECIAAAFGKKVIRHPEAEARLLAHYENTGLEFNAARQKMEDIPEDAALIDNPLSAAPGFILENVHVFAGVPSIMQAMFEGLRDSLPGGVAMTHTAQGCSGTYCLDACSGLEMELQGVDIFKYRYYMTGATSDLSSLGSAPLISPIHVRITDTFYSFSPHRTGHTLQQERRRPP